MRDPAHRPRMRQRADFWGTAAVRVDKKGDRNRVRCMRPSMAPFRCASGWAVENNHSCRTDLSSTTRQLLADAPNHCKGVIGPVRGVGYLAKQPIVLLDDSAVG